MQRMMRNNILVVGCLLWLLGGWHANSGCADDSESTMQQELQVFEEDPSLSLLLNASGEPATRIRLRGDFNHDGIEDLALSTDIRLFGNAGGHFELYLQTSQGQFILQGGFFGHPDAVAIEFPVRRDPRIWLYVRGGGGLGKIGYHELTESGLSAFSGITIFPGDGGSPLSNAIYAAVMDNSSVELIVERSETVDGHVVWKPDR